MFEWDEAKRSLNLEKHGLGFRDGGRVFAGPPFVVEARAVVGEKRPMAVGALGGRCVAVVFVERGAARRVISMRAARKHERAAFAALHGG